MNKYLMVLLILLCSCTLSVTCVHTQGKASDVVDEEQSPSTTASPTLSATIPVKAI